MARGFTAETRAAIDAAFLLLDAMDQAETRFAEAEKKYRLTGKPEDKIAMDAAKQLHKTAGKMADRECKKVRKRIEKEFSTN